jgi:hypothetical protein
MDMPYDDHAFNITHFLKYACCFTFNCTNKYTRKRSEAILQRKQIILTSKTCSSAEEREGAHHCVVYTPRSINMFEKPQFLSGSTLALRSQGRVLPLVVVGDAAVV